jgi:uncharacterized protein
MINSSPLAKDFWQNGRSSTCPIIDMHGHMGTFHSIYFPRAETADMLSTMDECGVKLLVFSHHHALMSADIGNTASIEAVRRYPDRLRAYCSVNPNYPERVAADIASFEQHNDVYVGFKFLADYHRIAITDARYQPALDYAEQHQLLVLMHTWGFSEYDGARHVREVAEKYPHAIFLLGHSIRNQWDEAVQIAHDCPNTYLELTSVDHVRGAMEKYVNEVGSDRMIFGTDLPWFDPHYFIGALLSADISDEDRHNICHRNAEKLLKPFAIKTIAI